MDPVPNGRGWSDIAYNYLACPHNYLFEGRGYDHQSSANGYESANEQSFAIQAMWGTKASVKVPDDLKRALLFAVDYLVDHGATRAIKGHRDWKSTDCPGDELYAWIKAGCPSPDSAKDWFDMATLQDLKTAVNDVLKTQALTNGQPLHELVQMYSAFNAKHDDQLVGTTVNATDTVLKDDFKAIADKVADLVVKQNSMQSTLDSILNKLNNLPA